MANPISRELANKLMRELSEKPTDVVFETLMYMTLSALIHVGKEHGDRNVSWQDMTHAQGLTYIAQLTRQLKRTVEENQPKADGKLISLPGVSNGLIIPDIKH